MWSRGCLTARISWRSVIKVGVKGATVHALRPPFCDANYDSCHAVDAKLRSLEASLAESR
jgi:hypothetical protein